MHLSIEGFDLLCPTTLWCFTEDVLWFFYAEDAVLLLETRVKSSGSIFTVSMYVYYCSAINPSCVRPSIILKHVELDSGKPAINTNITSEDFKIGKYVYFI